MQNQDIQDIILAKVSGEELSAGDEKVFESWYSDAGNRRYFNSLLDIKSGLLQSVTPQDGEVEKVWEGIRSSRRKSSLPQRFARYAAVFLILAMAGGGFVYLRDSQGVAPAVEPGRKMAYLVISDGKEVDLTTVGKFTDRGASITNSAGEGLAYAGTETGEAPSFHKIVIPRGGEYRLTLADGTRVWLNAESSLSYPTCFGDEARVVELEGEAYFSVKGDAERPFIVATADYDIRVTGTEFNVNSYAAGRTATTLVEGAVSIERDGAVTALHPGQQAAMTADGDIVVREVETYTYTAWRNGEFSFSSTRLDEIMEQLTRWYGIEVVYDDREVGAYRFFGGFSRQSDLNAMLSILEQTNKVRFRLKGDELTVYKR